MIKLLFDVRFWKMFIQSYFVGTQYLHRNVQFFIIKNNNNMTKINATTKSIDLL